MAEQPSRRINRIETPSIDVTFRDAVKLWTVKCWREDRLYHPGTQMTYLILDFGIEERIDHQEGDLPEEDQTWRPTGRVMVEIQQINADTGAGMALPMMREIADESSSVSAWVGWELEPCSPRRTVAEVPNPDFVLPPGATCLLCGDPAVYMDAERSPRCQRHIGESERGEGDLTDAEIEAILNGDV